MEGFLLDPTPPSLQTLKNLIKYGKMVYMCCTYHPKMYIYKMYRHLRILAGILKNLSVNENTYNLFWLPKTR